MKETCDFCNNLGYALTYNCKKDIDEIKRCDECFYNHKPWLFYSDKDAKAWDCLIKKVRQQDDRDS
tara:strand:- start:63 stop:260 length:198 start_codon:yes stop_codon:yes gene_type:complete